MTNTKSKAREFWIGESKDGFTDIKTSKPNDKSKWYDGYSASYYTPDSIVHVIEYQIYADLTETYEELAREYTDLKAKHERVLQMLEVAEAELKDARDFAMDTLARANQAIETDCDKCDYQCQGCIRAIDDAEAVKYNISIALEKIKSLKLPSKMRGVV